MRFAYAEAMTDPGFYLPLAQAAEAAGFAGFPERKAQGCGPPADPHAEPEAQGVWGAPPQMAGGRLRRPGARERGRKAAPTSSTTKLRFAVEGRSSPWATTRLRRAPPRR